MSRLLEICTDKELSLIHQLPELGCDFMLTGSAVVTTSFNDIDIVVLTPRGSAKRARLLKWLQECGATTWPESKYLLEDSSDSFQSWRIQDTRLNLVILSSPDFYERWVAATLFSTDHPELCQTRAARVMYYRAFLYGAYTRSGG